MNPRSGRSFDREILRLGVPALGALAAEPLYVLVDTAIVGHLGTAPLGGLAVASTVLATAFWMFNFLAYGTTAAVARAFGGGARREAVRHGVGAVWLGLGIGVVLAIAGVLFAGSASSLIGAEGAVHDAATTYLRISALGGPAVMVALAGMGFSRGMKDTRTPLVIALAANVANLVLELWFVYGMDLGVAGSAWATVIAQNGAAIAFGWIVVRTTRAQGESLRPHAESVRASVRVGAHLLVRTTSLLVGLAVVTSVATRIGDETVAAHQIAMQLWMFLALVLDAIAIAAQAMIGTMLGSGAADDARAAASRMIGWGIAAGIVFGALVAGSRGGLAQLFTSEEPVRAAVRDVLLIVAAMQPLNAVVFVLDGVLIGAGDAPFLARAMFAASAGVLIPGVLVVSALGGTLPLVWSVVVMFMLARLGGVWLRFRNGRWARIGVGNSRHGK